LSGVTQMKVRRDRIQALVEPVAAREGYELIDTEISVERGRTTIRLFIDTVPPGTEEKGVTVDDCAHISRITGDLLEVEDVMGGDYHLEVSSPGLFRPLTKAAHYDRAIGARVKIKTFEKKDNRRVYTGILKAHAEGQLTVEVDGAEFLIPLDDVAKANLEPLLD
jgi:ribosome maturation factor RimP